MDDVFDALVEAFPAWWIDALGEHNHVGGLPATKWLAERARVGPGDLVLDAGAFVGATARHVVHETGASAIATDLNHEFLHAGQQMEHGGAVDWMLAANQRLPFADGTFASVWCMDSTIIPKEFTRVAAERATLCLCCEAPVDGRGGNEAFAAEWEELGWQLAAHKPMTLEATQAWRSAEMDLVRRRPHYQERYGDRGYLMQLDIVSELLRMYEFGQQGHGLFVFMRGYGEM